MSFPYSTLPLPPSTHFIRVLKLPSSIPSTQPPTHSLTGTLHLVDLNANPPPNFTALSYVWGVPDPHTDYAVLCGGYRIPITPNCFAALSALSAKKSRSAEEGLTIWVDAICINQSDEEEKMRQIPLMGEIYHRAAETYIWLGEETEGRARAMRFLSGAGFTRWYELARGRLKGWNKVGVGVGVAVTMGAMFLPWGYPYPFESQSIYIHVSRFICGDLH